MSPQNDLEVEDPSHDEASPDDTGKAFKRQRRLHGACDACKRKKTKCDSAIMPNNVCSNCNNAHIPCTRTIPRQKKRDKQQEHIAQLEDRIRDLEGQLRASSSDHVSSSGDNTSERFASPLHDGNVSTAATNIPPPIPESYEFKDPANGVAVKVEEWDPSDTNQLVLAEQMMRISLDVDQGRFFGKSSILSMISEVVVAKNGFSDKSFVDFAAMKRNILWNARPWELEYANSEKLSYVFPEPDLSEKLLQAFRENVHVQLPALHWPSFMRDVQRGRHHVDGGFGTLLMAVYATASRFVDDERVVIIDTANPQYSGPSAGWMFISQTPLLRRSLVAQVQIVDLQYYVIAGFYFLGTSSPQVAWPLIGIAMRFAIEQGLHRRNPLRPKTRAQMELGKRVFWSLITLEWLTSTSLGRPACLHDEDIDIDYPLECDDEYWDSEVDDPAQAWKQPTGKPSMITALIYHLKLCEIASFMQRTIYSTKKSKLLSGRVGEQWEIRIISQLDSAMNKWKDSLPQHLRWDPRTPNLSDFNQQILIHAAFYYLQIQIHRPFLKPGTTLSLPGLALCTNAARACSHLAEAATTRTKFASLTVFVAAFAASTVLAINFWARDRRVSYSSQKELADMNKLLKFFKMGEKRWHLVGRFADLVTDFTTLSGVPITPYESSSPSRKRSRMDDSPIDSPTEAGWPPYNQGYSTLDNVTASSSCIPPSDVPPEEASLSSIPEISDCFIGNTTSPQLTFSSDWDLSNLILAQMGYSDKSEDMFPLNTGGNQGMPTATTSTQGYGDLDPSIFGTPSSSGPLPDTDAMSIWQSAPTAFCIEDWDNYIASLNNQPPLTGTSGF